MRFGHFGGLVTAILLLGVTASACGSAPPPSAESAFDFDSETAVPLESQTVVTVLVVDRGGQVRGGVVEDDVTGPNAWATGFRIGGIRAVPVTRDGQSVGYLMEGSIGFIPNDLATDDAISRLASCYAEIDRLLAIPTECRTLLAQQGFVESP